MKRLTAAIMLILIGAVIFASNPISFSGRYALVGSDGRTIRRTNVDVEGTGVVLATGEEKAKAEGSAFSLILGENSLAAIKDEEGLVIYLVYGCATVVSGDERDISVYTPTTKTTLSSKGEYHFISLDKEEKAYNFSSPDIELYDSIRGTYTTLSYNEGYDYIKGKKIEVDENKRYLETPIHVLTPVFTDEVYSYLTGSPDTPVLSISEQFMAGTPDAPIFVKKESEVINDPDTPIILDNVVQTIVDSSFSPISVTQKLYDSENNN